MAVKVVNLTCFTHICKRIAETSGFKDFTSLAPYFSLKKSGNLDCVGIEIPLKYLSSSFKVNDATDILKMKSDQIIRRIYESPDRVSITFDVKKEELMKSVLNSYLKSPLTGKSSHTSKTVLVEFSSPNIAKPFHVGHLRSTIIGNFVANIIELNHIVKRLNYLGDWGTQIGFVKAGLETSNIGDISLLENPMKAMYNAYTLAYSDETMMRKAKEIFSDLEKGGDWQKEWGMIRSITIDHLKKTYNSFGIIFDEYSYESKYRAANISAIVKQMEENKLTTFENNCLVMEINGKKVPLFKSDGTTLYLVRDIAAALDRLENYSCDKMLYVVDKSQSDHLNRLKFAISKITHMDKVHHIPFGRITGMSTRKGTSIFLDDILNETIDKMAEQQLKSPNTRTSDLEVTKILGVTALMVYILRQKRNRDFNFSWKNALQGSGDTGVKLQYTHSRLCSLEKKCNVSLPDEANPTPLEEPIVFDLIFELARFSEVLKSSEEHLESSFLVSYLFRLCNLVSRALKDLPVKGQNSDIATQRLLMFYTVRCTIASSMKILGLKPLNEM